MYDNPSIIYYPKTNIVKTLNTLLDNLLASFSLHSEDVALTSMKTMGVSTLHSGVSYF